jgi:hypothetical protein
MSWVQICDVELLWTASIAQGLFLLLERMQIIGEGAVEYRVLLGQVVMMEDHQVQGQKMV